MFQNILAFYSEISQAFQILNMIYLTYFSQSYWVLLTSQLSVNHIDFVQLLTNTIIINLPQEFC